MFRVARVAHHRDFEHIEALPDQARQIDRQIFPIVQLLPELQRNTVEPEVRLRYPAIRSNGPVVIWWSLTLRPLHASQSNHLRLFADCTPFGSARGSRQQSCYSRQFFRMQTKRQFLDRFVRVCHPLWFCDEPLPKVIHCR